MSIKLAMQKIANKIGYTIAKIKKPDLSLYNEYPRESLLGKRFYNIGAGSFRHPYWTNVDYSTEHYSLIQNGSEFIHYDLMELSPLPIPDNFAELIYSSHTIEHVSDDAVINMLRESYRALKPGGAIRLTTPDADLGFKAFMRNDLSYWHWWYPFKNPSIPQYFLHHYASQLCEIDPDESPQKKYSDSEIISIFHNDPKVETIDFFTRQCKYNPQYPGSHINWWTGDKLIKFLIRAGFSAPYRSGWGQSVFRPLREVALFDNTFPSMSLYVEAVK